MSITRHDDVYDALISAQTGMTEAESLRFSARLILLLVNAVDDAAALSAIAAARESPRQAGSPAGSETTANNG